METASWNFFAVTEHRYGLYHLRPYDGGHNCQIQKGSFDKWLLKDFDFGLVTTDGEIGRIKGGANDMEDPAIYHDSREAAEEALMLRLLKKANQ